MNSATLVQNLWNYYNVLREDAMSYGDYVEQLAYLLFLKMIQASPTGVGVVVETRKERPTLC